jgi:hypothetical protein
MAEQRIGSRVPSFQVQRCFVRTRIVTGHTTLHRQAWIDRQQNYEEVINFTEDCTKLVLATDEEFEGDTTATQSRSLGWATPLTVTVTTCTSANPVPASVVIVASGNSAEHDARDLRRLMALKRSFRST